MWIKCVLVGNHRNGIAFRKSRRAEKFMSKRPNDICMYIDIAILVVISFFFFFHFCFFCRTSLPHFIYTALFPLSPCSSFTLFAHIVHTLFGIGTLGLSFCVTLMVIKFNISKNLCEFNRIEPNIVKCAARIHFKSNKYIMRICVCVCVRVLMYTL